MLSSVLTKRSGMRPATQHRVRFGVAYNGDSPVGSEIKKLKFKQRRSIRQLKRREKKLVPEASELEERVNLVKKYPHGKADSVTDVLWDERDLIKLGDHEWKHITSLSCSCKQPRFAGGLIEFCGLVAAYPDDTDSDSDTESNIEDRHDFEMPCPLNHGPEGFTLEDGKALIKQYETCLLNLATVQDKLYDLSACSASKCNGMTVLNDSTCICSKCGFSESIEGKDFKFKKNHARHKLDELKQRKGSSTVTLCNSLKANMGYHDFENYNSHDWDDTPNTDTLRMKNVLLTLRGNIVKYMEKYGLKMWDLTQFHEIEEMAYTYRKLRQAELDSRHKQIRALENNRSEWFSQTVAIFSLLLFIRRDPVMFSNMNAVRELYCMANDKKNDAKKMPVVDRIINLLKHPTCNHREAAEEKNLILTDDVLLVKTPHEGEIFNVSVSVKVFIGISESWCFEDLTIVSGPSHGTITTEGNTLVYSPNPTSMGTTGIHTKAKVVLLDGVLMKINAKTSQARRHLESVISKAKHLPVLPEDTDVDEAKENVRSLEAMQRKVGDMHQTLHLEYSNLRKDMVVDEFELSYRGKSAYVVVHHYHGVIDKSFSSIFKSVIIDESPPPTWPLSFEIDGKMFAAGRYKELPLKQCSGINMRPALVDMEDGQSVMGWIMQPNTRASALDETKRVCLVFRNKDSGEFLLTSDNNPVNEFRQNYICIERGAFKTNAAAQLHKMLCSKSPLGKLFGCLPLPNPDQQVQLVLDMARMIFFKEPKKQKGLRPLTLNGRLNQKRKSAEGKFVEAFLRIDVARNNHTLDSPMKKVGDVYRHFVRKPNGTTHCFTRQVDEVYSVKYFVQRFKVRMHSKDSVKVIFEKMKEIEQLVEEDPECHWGQYTIREKKLLELFHKTNWVWDIMQQEYGPVKKWHVISKTMTKSNVETLSWIGKEEFVDLFVAKCGSNALQEIQAKANPVIVAYLAQLEFQDKAVELFQSIMDWKRRTPNRNGKALYKEMYAFMEEFLSDQRKRISGIKKYSSRIEIFCTEYIPNFFATKYMRLNTENPMDVDVVMNMRSAMKRYIDSKRRVRPFDDTMQSHVPAPPPSKRLRTEETHRSTKRKRCDEEEKQAEALQSDSVQSKAQRGAKPKGRIGGKIVVEGARRKNNRCLTLDSTLDRKTFFCTVCDCRESHVVTRVDHDSLILKAICRRCYGEGIYEPPESESEFEESESEEAKEAEEEKEGADDGRHKRKYLEQLEDLQATIMKNSPSVFSLADEDEKLRQKMFDLNACISGDNAPMPYEYLSAGRAKERMKKIRKLQKERGIIPHDDPEPETLLNYMPRTRFEDPVWLKAQEAQRLHDEKMKAAAAQAKREREELVKQRQIEAAIRMAQRAPLFQPNEADEFSGFYDISMN